MNTGLVPGARFCARFAGLVGLLLALGCEPTPERVEAADKVVTAVLEKNIQHQIETSLKARYAEPFEVDESFFEMGLNMYQFKAHPKNAPEIVVHGNFDERQGTPRERLRSDDYANAAFSHHARRHLESLADGDHHRAIGASVYSRHEHTHGERLIEFDDYLKARPPKSTIRLNRYFFEVPSSPSNPVVRELRANLEALQAKYGDQFSLYAGFWNPQFLDGRDPDDLSWGFESHSIEDADDLVTKLQHLEKYFFVKVKSGSRPNLTDEKVFELIRPAAKNGPDEMTEL